MKNKSVSSTSKGFAGWIEDFITGLAVKEASTQPQEEQVEEKEEILAEINLNDLDKVVWKEESFGVHFDEKGASLINEFGNVVRTLQDAKTIDEVDKQLNGSEIVVAEIEEEIEIEDDLQEELAKIADSLENTSTENTDNEDFEEEEVKTAKVEEEEIEETEEDTVVAAIASGFEELEATISSLSERLALVEQQYARNPELLQDNMSTQVQEEENKHFTETADETAKEVAHEQSVDLTSPAGRVELSTHTNETSQVEDIVTQDTTPVEEQVTEEVSTEEVKEVEETEEPTKETEEEVKTAAEVVEEEDGTTEEPSVEKLAGVAEKIFQKGVCPETGEELVKSKTVGNYLGVYSTAGTEYAVDLTTGSIYKYLK